MTHKKLRSARMRPAYNSQPIFGLGTIDAESASAWFYGWAKGLQYKGMGEGDRQGVEDAAQSDAVETPVTDVAAVDTATDVSTPKTAAPVVVAASDDVAPVVEAETIPSEPEVVDAVAKSADTASAEAAAAEAVAAEVALPG